MKAHDLRQKRMAAGLTGAVICLRTGMCRSRLSEIERGYVTPTAEEISNIEGALQELIAARQKVDEFATTVGWPVGVMG